MTFRLTFWLLLLLTHLVSAQVALVTPTPVPSSSATDGAEAVAPALLTPAAFPRYDDTGVYHVRNDRRPSANPETDACVARRDDVITIYVKHLKSWLSDPQRKDRFPKDAKVSDLIPFLEDVPLNGIHSEQSWPEPPDTDSKDSPQVHYLRFTLSRTETSKDAWTQILNRPHFTRPMKVSVGLKNGEEMPTYVLPTAAKTGKTGTCLLLR